MVADFFFELFHLIGKGGSGTGVLDQFSERLILRQAEQFSAEFLENLFIRPFFRIVVAFLDYANGCIYSLHDEVSVVLVFPQLQLLILMVLLILSSTDLDVLS